VSVRYWDDFDCTAETRRIAHPDTVHVHCETDRQAGEAFLRLYGRWILRSDLGDGFGHHERSLPLRYGCVRGPGGLVRAVELY
jgi:hypothetical protein